MTDGSKGDYDSDTILMTDDPLLLGVAQRNYNNFLVPTNMTTSVKTERHYAMSDKADLDVRTSVNKIGEIINLSQQLNSLMWDHMSKGASFVDCEELYMDICKLAVLSNVEIDRAKREFVINSATEIKILKDKYKITDDEKTVKPMFFKLITTENGYVLSDNVKYKYFNTTMDYLQKIISKFNFRIGHVDKLKTEPFMSIVKEPNMYTRHSFYYGQKDRIIETIRTAHAERKQLFIDYDSLSKDERANVLRMSNELRQECVEEVMKISNSQATMYLVLKELDKKETRDVSRFVFEVLFGRPDQEFFKLIRQSAEDIYILDECESGDISYYGFKFSKKKISRKDVSGLYSSEIANI